MKIANGEVPGQRMGRMEAPRWPQYTEGSSAAGRREGGGNADQIKLTHCEAQTLRGTGATGCVEISTAQQGGGRSKARLQNED